MLTLFVDNPHVVQMLSMLGIGAILVIAGCLLSDSMAELLGRFRRLGWACKIGVLVVVAQLTMFGGAKHGGTNDVDDVTGTNEVEMVGGGGQSNLTSCAFGLEVGEAASSPLRLGMLPPPTSGETPLPQTDVLSDFTRGYRLECVTTNDDISYAMPSGATVRGMWHLTGAYEDVQKVSLVAYSSSPVFLFPLGTNLCDSLWAYTWGKVRPQLKNIVNEIAAVCAPMSAIPFVSRFWTAATTNDTYLLTWENFTLGRISGEAESFPLQNGIVPPLTSGEDTASPLTSGVTPLPLVSAQIELFRNGDFITRSNNVESVYRRVIEPNPIGPVNPPDPENPAMTIRPYGPVQDLSVINETNAYCWVDIVVAADAWVRFEGDGPSNLADPSFAAKAGETNRVVILIGKTYKVTCDMDFSVVGKSDPAIDERWEDDHTVWLNRPVTIEAWEGNGNSFRMHVIPNFLGGFFSWTNSCCSVVGSGTHFSYSCDGHCYCTGCAANGYYGYEGYRIGCNGGWCGCTSVPGEWEGNDDPYDSDPAPSVSVWFEDAAVIFEDAYTNRPGEVVERMSTRTVLHLVAHGGMKGGTATFSFENRDKLVGFDIPTSLDVPAGHCMSYRFAYRGRLPSGSENDIKVHGEFQENNADEDCESLTSDAELTSVKVELVRKKEAPEEICVNRHIFGVQEGADVYRYPSSVKLSISFNSDDAVIGIDNEWFYCPWTGGSYSLSISTGNVEFITRILVVEPKVVCRSAEWDRVRGTVGCSGQVRMNLFLYVEPLYVSFDGVFMEEVPDTTICPHDGYFNDSDTSKTGAMSHSESARAGEWIQVHQDEWAADRVERLQPYPQPWTSGWKEWQIPVGWGDVFHNLKGQIHPNPTTQRFTIAPDGTATIRKYNHEIERRTNNDVYLDGVLQQ